MIEVGKIYWHYKNPNQFYNVLALAKNTETMEDMVVYQALYGENPVWVRPAKMWDELVNGIPRFQLKKD